MSPPLTLDQVAPAPAQGQVKTGYEPLAQVFAEQLENEEVGAALAVYRHGELVVDLWGGVADVASGRAWQRNTRALVFSVTKGVVAMAMNMLVERSGMDWDTPIATFWPGFAAAGKDAITLRMLLNHRAGLPYLDEPLKLTDCTSEAQADKVLRALESQHPAWSPGGKQGYHALTYGLYVSEVFERIAGEPLRDYLHRELLDPLGSDARLGSEARYDADTATLIAPSVPRRVAGMLGSVLFRPQSPEARIARSVLQRDSLSRRAFSNPSTGPAGVLAYDTESSRRASLAWASLTSSANGVARAYLPFANRGEFGGRRYLKTENLTALYRRQSWAVRDQVLQKPLGWSQGFLKEERHLFSPNPESFGHAGLGGALGWCDPVAGITIGYVMNRLDWRVRSPRALNLCHALYECEPLRS